MKHIRKIFLISLMILTILSTVKSLNAEELYNLNKVTPITNKSLEVELNKKTILDKGLINSDFKIYKDIKISSITIDAIDKKKVNVNIGGVFKDNSSYSILLISGSEGNIEFETGNEFIGKEIKNSNLEDIQGIEKIVIRSGTQIELYFLQNLVENNIELKLYKDLFVDKTIKNEKINILLKNKLDNNSQYISTLTLLEDKKLKKINIKDGVYDFTTNILKEYNNEFKEDKNNSLENKLLNALEGTKVEDISENLLDEEIEINNQIKKDLNSAKETKEQTQLEKIALGTKETPDTGAETWVLIFGTFIINTFYFLSRRKKNNLVK